MRICHRLEQNAKQRLYVACAAWREQSGTFEAPCHKTCHLTHSNQVSRFNHGGVDSVDRVGPGSDSASSESELGPTLKQVP